MQPWTNHAIFSCASGSRGTRISPGFGTVAARIEQSVWRTVRRFVPQRLEGWVQDLVHQAVERTGDFFPGTRVDFSQFVEQPCEFVGFQLIGLILQPLDRGCGSPVIQFRQETSRLVLNDPAALGPSFSRSRRLASQACCRSSSEYKYTLGKSPMPGSKSRGTARSRANSGRSDRRWRIRRNCCSVITGSLAPVVLITRSAAAIWSYSASHG